MSLSESALCALLDAHDALVRACLEGGLSFAEFALAYGDFPGACGLDERDASPGGQAMVERARDRLAFHRHVAALLSGLASRNDEQMGLMGGAGGFLEKAVFMRLRQWVERCPGYRVPGAGADPSVGMR